MLYLVPLVFAFGIQDQVGHNGRSDWERPHGSYVDGLAPWVFHHIHKRQMVFHFHVSSRESIDIIRNHYPSIGLNKTVDNKVDQLDLIREL